MSDPEWAILNLLNHLYDQITTPERWPDFLAGLARSFRSDVISIRLVSRCDDGVCRAFVTGFQQKTNQYFESRAFCSDPFNETFRQHPMGTVLTDLRPPPGHLNDSYTLAIPANQQQSPHAFRLVLNRPRTEGRYSDTETLALQHLCPHLKRISQLAERLQELHQNVISRRQALDRLAFAAWQMDEELNVEWLNQTGWETLKTGAYGLTLTANRLDSASHSINRAVKEGITQLLNSPATNHTISLASNGAGLLLELCNQYANTDFAEMKNPPAFLCFLLDPDNITELHDNQLQALYQLTPAELRLANQLVSGLDVLEASANLGVSANTVRTQLKSIMRKTGVNRQTQLQRKLLLGSSTLRHTGH